LTLKILTLSLGFRSMHSFDFPTMVGEEIIGAVLNGIYSLPSFAESWALLCIAPDHET
jgi:hypothetical protein